MGTSNTYGGPKGGTPLVPSWLEPNNGSSDAGAGQPGDSPSNPQLNPPERPPMPPAGDPDRFRTARTYYSRFAGSGGRDRASLGRAISSYVSRASGGARRAAQRMGASKIAGTKLANFLYIAANQGISQALQTLNFESLAGLPIEEVFIGMVDYICPEGGTIDEGIAREAFIETIADLTENGITSLDGMTPEQVQTVFELYATHSIEARLCNDIGNKAIILPADPREVANVQAQLHDFIRRGVADALSQSRMTIQTLTPDRVQNFVDQVYEQAFSILQVLGEAEGDAI